MKPLLIAITLTALSMTVGCGKRASSGTSIIGSEAGPYANPFSYDFKTQTCDTYQRTFNSKTEMCLSVQIDSNNNQGCAPVARQNFFNQQSCSSVAMSWNPSQADQQLRYLNGKYVECELIDGQDTISQFTSFETLTLNSTNYRAVITHERNADQSITLTMRVFDQLTNQSTLQLQKSWPAGVIPQTVALPSDKPVLNCLVTITHQ